MKPRKVLRLRIEKPEVGYIVKADIGVLGFYKTIAAVTTRTEAITAVQNTIEAQLTE